MEAKAYGFVQKAVFWLTVLLASMLIVSVTLNVLSRYILGTSILWSEEAARFLFVWLSFLGIVIANDKNEHMHLDLLLQYSPKPVGKVLQLIANTACLAITLLLIWGGVIVSKESMDWMSPILEIPYGFVYSIAPACCVILVWQYIRRYAMLIRTGDEGGDA